MIKYRESVSIGLSILSHILQLLYHEAGRGRKRWVFFSQITDSHEYIFGSTVGGKSCSSVVKMVEKTIFIPVFYRRFYIEWLWDDRFLACKMPGRVVCECRYVAADRKWK